MISIYHAANLADAYLVRQLLEQERIDAYVAGEYLQGALGDIPANTPIEVRVASEHAARARQIVEEWEQTPIDQALFDEDDTAVSKHASTTRLIANPENTRFRVFSAIAWLLSGGVIGASLIWSAYNGPRRESSIDYDGDGIAEERLLFAGDRLQRTEIDRNRDRKPDEIRYYGRFGAIERDEVDQDFDGVMEQRSEYVNGQPVLTKINRDSDERVVFRTDYLRGVRYRDEWLDAAGNVVKRVEYRDGSPVTGAFDRDGDGRLDIERTYDARGEIIETQALPER
jgi:hypothetical protein